MSIHEALISLIDIAEDFTADSVVKNQPANARVTGDMGSNPGLGRSPGGGNGNPLQCSCLENPHRQRGLFSSERIHKLWKFTQLL